MPPVLYTCKTYTLLLKKIYYNQDFIFGSISSHSGELESNSSYSECSMNKQFQLVSIEKRGQGDDEIVFHIMHDYGNDINQIGNVLFNMREEKILKPLSKEFFTKNFTNKKGKIEYRFINSAVEEMDEREAAKFDERKKEIICRMEENQQKKDSSSLVELLQEKDRVIESLEQQIKKLISETSKMRKTMSRERKDTSKEKIDQLMNLNIKVKHYNNDSEKMSLLYQSEKQDLARKIEKMEKQIKQLEKREKNYLRQIDQLQFERKKSQKQTQLKKNFQKKMSEFDLMKNRDQISEEQFKKQERKMTREYENEIRGMERKHEIERQKLSEKFSDMERSKIRQAQRDKQEWERRIYDLENELERERQRNIRQQRSIENLVEKSGSENSFVWNSIDKQRKMLNMESLEQQLLLKDQEISNLKRNLEKKKNEVFKLEDEAFELRRKLSQKAKLKASMMDNEVGQIMEEQNIQLEVEKLNSRIEEITREKDRMEDQYKEKLDERELQLKRVTISEKKMSTQREMYENKMNEMMSQMEVEKKQYLEAREKAQKYKTQVNRTNELEAQNVDLHNQLMRSEKEKKEHQNSIQKLKTIINERDEKWQYYKGLEMQYNFIKKEHEDLERANKKLEEQYKMINTYLRKVQMTVDRKPIAKGKNEELNRQKEEKYQMELINRLDEMDEAMRNMEQKFYNEQLDIYRSQKTNTIALFMRKLDEEKNKIRNDIDLSQENKHELMKTKEKELIEKRDNQLNSIDRKINEVLKKKGTAIVEKSHIANEDLSGKLSHLQEKLQKMRESEDIKQKQIQTLHVKIKSLEENVENKKSTILELQRNKGGTSKSIAMLGSNYERGSYEKYDRQSLWQDFKKKRDQYAKQLSETNKEKLKVEGEFREYRYRQERQISKLNDKVNLMESGKRKLTDELERQRENMKNLKDRNNEEAEKWRTMKREFEETLRKCSEQIRNYDFELTKKERQFNEALEEIKRLDEKVRIYEDGEVRLVEQLNLLKKKAFDDEERMGEMVEQMKANFVKTQEIKNAKIVKLADEITTLNKKLEKEVQESLQVKDENEKYMLKMLEYDNQLKQTKESQKLTKENHEAYIVQTMEEKNQLEEQNAQLIEQLNKMIKDLEEKQKQMQILSVNFGASEDKVKKLQEMRENWGKEQSERKAQRENCDKIIEQQQKSIQSMQIQYNRLKKKVQQNSEEFDQLNRKNIILENEREKYKNIEYEKEIQIMEMKNRFETMKIKYENELQKNSQAKEKILKLQDKNEKLIFEIASKPQVSEFEKKSEKRDSKQKIKHSDSRLQKSHRQISIPLRKSKVSRMQSQNQIVSPSPQKSFSLSRRNSAKPSESDSKHSRAGSMEKLLPVEENDDEMKGTMLMPKKKKSQEHEQMVIFDDPSKVNLSKDEPAQVNKEESYIENVKSEEEQINVTELLQERENRIEELETEIIELREENEQLKEEYEQLKNGYEVEKNAWKMALEKEGDEQMSGLNPDQKSLHKKSMSKLSRKETMQRFFDVQKSAQKIDVVKNNEEMEELKKKVAENELYIEELEMKVLQSKKQNEEITEELKNQLEQVWKDSQKKQEEIENLANILKYKEKNFQEVTDQLKMKISQLTEEDLRKRETIQGDVELINQLERQDKEKDEFIAQIQDQLLETKKQLDKAKKQIATQKGNFRKYEEEAELEILKLKECVEGIEEELEEKKKEVEIIADKFVEMEELSEKYKSQSEEKNQLLLKERAKMKEFSIKYSQMNEENSRKDKIRYNLNEKIGDMEMQSRQKDEEIKKVNKETAIALKKCEIRIEKEKQEHNLSRKKLKEREEHISTLKLQIGRYNELTRQMEKDKNSLENEIIKMEKELRDIMNTYQGELNGLQKEKSIKDRKLEKTLQTVKEKDDQIDLLNKEVVKKDKQIRQLGYRIQNQEKEGRRQLEKGRSQIGDVYAQLEMKNNEYQKVKVQLERESEHFFKKEYEYIAEKEKKDTIINDYKEKFVKYEKTLQEMQSEVESFGSRPTNEEWEEVCFENELYKNRVEELEALSKQNDQEQQQKIYLEFRRYKMNKEREIQDLQAEMQKYSSKFQDLEENNYLIKKDNDTMKEQMRSGMQERIRLQKSIQEMQEDNRELKEQLEFYKARRVEDLNKLLNETYD